MGVFSAKTSPNVDAKRNTFPLSFSNNLTMQFGKIYPVFVKPCDPGDSFNIKASFGLNFLPTVYPVQTPMKAYLHFFYCRNRTVWTDFMNFYTMKDRAGQNTATSTYVPPYLDFAKQKLGASELADYMGIPIVESSGNVPVSGFSKMDYVLPLNSASSTADISTGISVSMSSDVITSFATALNLSNNPSSVSVSSGNTSIPYIPVSVSGTIFEGKTMSDLLSEIQLNPSRRLSFSLSVDLYRSSSSAALDAKGLDAASVTAANSLLNTLEPSFFFMPIFDATGKFIGRISLSSVQSYSGMLQRSAGSERSFVTLTLEFSAIASIAILNSDTTSLVSYIGIPVTRFRTSADTADYRTGLEVILCSLRMSGKAASSGALSLSSNGVLSVDGSSTSLLPPRVNSFTFDWNSEASVVASPTELSSPYYNSENLPTGLKVSSLPFRHYEAIYNYFYRDNRNNPLRDADGNPVYNEVLLPSQLTGGAETTGYDFHYRNWEQDFLTTCVQEPQLGQAPLVGISSTGVASFQNEDGTTTNVQLRVAADGDTIEGFDTSEGVSAPVAHSLVELATQGISISDFRNVNAFQTWLEVQMRKTLRFGDSIQGHFNVNPKYDDYLYPEFIGGVTQDVDTYQVNQTSPSSDAPLGSYAGQAICKGSVPRAISKFCDEPGYIIGLLSLVPQPVYSQILPKHYLRRETLDYHFPEFNNISYQPVTYAEVCPVLAYNDQKALDSVFGYQRPWYDLISSLDEAHGQFLTTLNGFILSRRFVSYPSLGERFLTVHPEDLNDIFSTKMTDSNDVVLGQLYFDVVKKTQISKFGIPSLQVG